MKSTETRDMNDSIAAYCSSVPLNKISYNNAKVRIFFSELCCSTIIHLLFHYFYCLDSYLSF